MYLKRNDIGRSITKSGGTGNGRVYGSGFFEKDNRLKGSGFFDEEAEKKKILGIFKL